MGYKIKCNTLFNVAGYIRLSRDDGDKEESDSVGNQRRLLTNYIDKKKDFFIFDMYIDDGYTGTDFNRPAFQRMLRDIKDGKVNCVIVKDLSRFGRDYIETGRYLERVFPDFNVRFISIVDGIDSYKQTYDMLMPIKNIFNEQYARDISKKVQTVMKSKQKSGEFIGAFACYGYKKSSTNKNKLIIDAYASNVIKRIFSLYVRGYGKARIAAILNAEGILCPSEYKKLNGENYKNSKRLESTTYWTFSTINKILQKEMYIGNMVQGTRHQHMRGKQRLVNKEDWIVVTGTHEAIIDIETWKKAQTLLNKRTRKLDLENNQSIFAGFLKCGDCGRAMTKNFWKNVDNAKRYMYVCGTYKRAGKKYCTSHSIRHDILERIVLDDLKKVISSIDNVQELIKSQNFSIKKDQKITESEIHKLSTELDKVTRFKKSIYEDYQEELLTKDEYLRYRADYLKKEVLYSKQLQVLKKQQSNTIIEDKFQSTWLKRLLELKEIEKLDREIIVEMISKIKIYENRKIKIIYNLSTSLEPLFIKHSDEI